MSDSPDLALDSPGFRDSQPPRLGREFLCGLRSRRRRLLRRGAASTGGASREARLPRGASRPGRWGRSGAGPQVVESIQGIGRDRPVFERAGLGASCIGPALRERLVELSSEPDRRTLLFDRSKLEPVPRSARSDSDRRIRRSPEDSCRGSETSRRKRPSICRSGRGGCGGLPSKTA